MFKFYLLEETPIYLLNNELLRLNFDYNRVMLMDKKTKIFHLKTLGYKYINFR